MFVKFFNVFIKAVYLLNLFECIIVCSNNDIHIFSREFLWTEVKMVDYSDIRGIRYNRASEWKAKKRENMGCYPAKI